MPSSWCHRRGTQLASRLDVSAFRLVCYEGKGVELPNHARIGGRLLQLVPRDVGDSTGVSQRFLGILYTRTWQTRSNTKTTILGMSQATLSP